MLIQLFFFYLAGQNAEFEVLFGTAPESVTWLKDNRPINEIMSDRAKVTTENDNKNFKMELKNCVESDSGSYTALATSKTGRSSSTAQLLVHECKLKNNNPVIHISHI